MMNKNVLSSLMLFISIHASADKLVLLTTPSDSIKARVDHISAAQQEIKVQYFAIEQDDLATTGLALLKSAADRGVKVKILVDSLHNFMMDATMAAVLGNHKPQLSSNIEIREYNKFNIFAPLRYTKRMHDKAMIIDNMALITGGRNVANGYYGKKFSFSNGELHPILEDTDALVFESASINEASEYFDNLWNSRFVKPVSLYEYSQRALSQDYCEKLNRPTEKNFGQKAACLSRQKKRLEKINREEHRMNDIMIDYMANFKINTISDWQAKANDVNSIQYIYDNPVNQKNSLKKPKNDIGEQLYKIIGDATESVTIIAPYFIVTPEQEELFIKLKNKNVKVHVITNSENSNNVPPAHVGYLRTRHLAIKQNVEISEYNGPDTLHSKMILIDNRILYLGSFNWDYRSQNLNREVGIVTELPEDRKNDLTEDVFDNFSRIITRSTPINEKSKLNNDAGDLDEKDMQALAKQIRNGNKNNLIWHILFPFIKKQL